MVYVLVYTKEGGGEREKNSRFNRSTNYNKKTQFKQHVDYHVLTRSYTDKQVAMKYLFFDFML